ncbi:hypothetical protein J3459_016577 [Metarhizium acridum]|uniref:Aminoglycoside phosphotransferase domain-containing protein n=1 Tax=Metarhizium acridum (strain CQMa 102) TaxID=655827 RepID=E9EH23_METAQ|nr:uncharacterized protein MAC_09171 [Metarhizium acridum CQMa 102]EFY84768.1 hypothetical protein MAC_09171 [Metarhizium acridum CQMa 102]KAG8411181.1 hypothetical protein J3459_016577 [Metarhizium acridum]
MSGNLSSNAAPVLNWANTDVDEVPLGAVDWEALLQYAKVTRQKLEKRDIPFTCQLSVEYNKGGRNLVRRLHFQDGACWLVRIQLHNPTPESIQRLEQEVHTMSVVRERSEIPVPEVYAYEANYDNVFGAPFMLMEFLPGDTIMDSFGGYEVHKGKIPENFTPDFHATLADIQVQMSAIRFPQIGGIVKASNGTYCVGPLPGVGGPFDSPAQFLEAWADHLKFPYSEKTIRERTPPQLVDEILESIRSFPSRLKELAKEYSFRTGPFPLFHTDLYRSNIVLASQYYVIDWEDSCILPWEMVEFAKDLGRLPPALDGPLYQEDETDRKRLAERENYIKLVKTAEASRGLDDHLSATLGNSAVQNLAHAMWLYQIDGRIGFYNDVINFVQAR